MDSKCSSPKSCAANWVGWSSHRCAGRPRLRQGLVSKFWHHSVGGTTIPFSLAKLACVAPHDLQLWTGDWTPCEQDATWSLIPKSTVHSSNGILPLFVVFVPILQWSMASVAAPHPICVFPLFSMVKLQGQTPPWGIPPNRKTFWRTYVWF